MALPGSPSFQVPSAKLILMASNIFFEALPVFLPPRLARKFEKIAKAKSKTKGQLFEDMI